MCVMHAIHYMRRGFSRMIDGSWTTILGCHHRCHQNLKIQWLITQWRVIIDRQTYIHLCEKHFGFSVHIKASHVIYSSSMNETLELKGKV